jgi:hypothetical protein
VARFPNCSAALEALARGLDEKVCHDFRALRQVVACRAWHQAKTEPFSPETFQHRISDAWREVEKVCERHGGTTPQTGFLGTKQVTRTLPPEAFAQAVNVKEIKQGGEHAGVMVELSDGSQVICLHDKCETVRGVTQTETIETLLRIYGLDLE